MEITAHDRGEGWGRAYVWDGGGSVRPGSGRNAGGEAGGRLSDIRGMTRRSWGLRHSTLFDLYSHSIKSWMDGNGSETDPRAAALLLPPRLQMDRVTLNPRTSKRTAEMNFM